MLLLGCCDFGFIDVALLLLVGGLRVLGVCGVGLVCWCLLYYLVCGRLVGFCYV